MAPLSDDALRDLLRTDPDAGWRAFIDQYTPLLVGLIRRAGVDDRDETMDVYVLICERLSANGFERLKTQNAARGSTGGWLAVLARNAAVDWIRSKKGRRRLFESIKHLSPLDQRVFELYFWDERTPAEIASIARVDLAQILESLERVQSALNERHRAELMATMLRSKAPVPIDDTDAAERIADDRMNPETAAQAAQINERLESAIRKLPSDDAVIVRMKFIEGLTNAQIERSTGISNITMARLTAILATLRGAL